MVIKKPKRSRLVKFSSKKSQAIEADVAGIKKNIETVLLAELFLIKNNSASKTVSIFFLIPATSAFMAWLFLNESLTNLDLLGFLVTTIGVYIATRD